MFSRDVDEVDEVYPLKLLSARNLVIFVDSVKSTDQLCNEGRFKS